jgi:hypothetical protein
LPENSTLKDSIISEVSSEGVPCELKTSYQRNLFCSVLLISASYFKFQLLTSVFTRANVYIHNESITVKDKFPVSAASKLLLFRILNKFMVPGEE